MTKRWLTDSALYNEWMNEHDYEPEDAEQDAGATAASCG